MFSFQGYFFTKEIWYHIVPLAPKASGFPLFQNPDILISESFSNTIVFLNLWRILHEKDTWQNWSRRMRITMWTMTLTWQTKGVREFANIISGESRSQIHQKRKLLFLLKCNSYRKRLLWCINQRTIFC